MANAFRLVQDEQKYLPEAKLPVPQLIGGLMVAGGQMTITLGAMLGGIVFDVAGAVPTFWSSAGVLAVQP